MVRLKDLRMRDGRPALLVARENGISQGALVTRLAKGWPMDDAVSRPMVQHGFQKFSTTGSRGATGDHSVHRASSEKGRMA